MSNFFESIDINRVNEVSLDFDHSITQNDTGIEHVKIRVMRINNQKFYPLIIDSPYTVPDTRISWQTAEIFENKDKGQMISIIFGNSKHKLLWLNGFSKIMYQIIEQITMRYPDIALQIFKS